MAITVFTRIDEIKQRLDSLRQKNKTIGFVPTMGALHEGHTSLIRRSEAENDITVCSIFVNKIQFNNPADFATYPRMIEQDRRLLEKEQSDILFAPPHEEMYPEGETQNLNIDFGNLANVMEGRYRPGHFRGVAIVVNKLFSVIGSCKAYFGKKDFQQLRIISEMVRLLDLPVEIIPCETVREPDGLAMSSRNLRLTIGERMLAAKIFETLMFVRDHAGSVSPRKLQSMAMQRLNQVEGFDPQYFEIVDAGTLMPIRKWDETRSPLACTAVNVGDIRLIDNMELFS
jgi:pantoate--beta-alanine ligase